MQQKTVPCEICGKLVKNKNLLKQHVRLVHERKGGEFPCGQCGKIIKSEASLEYHPKAHTGDYAYRCDEAIGVLDSPQQVQFPGMEDRSYCYETTEFEEEISHVTLECDHLKSLICAIDTDLPGDGSDLVPGYN